MIPEVFDDAPPVEPKPVTQRLLDVCFGGGVPDQSLTLWPIDKVDFLTNGDIVVQFHEKSQETIVMKGSHIRWYSVREHVFTPPPKKHAATGSV